MFNECLSHLFDCTCLNVMCVCSSLYDSNQKDFWSFYMYLEVIFITLSVHDICLPFFYFFLFFLFKHVLCWKKQVSEFLATRFGDLQATRPSHEFWQLVLATCKPWDLVTSLHRMVSRLSLQLASREFPKTSFLKRFFVGNLF